MDHPPESPLEPLPVDPDYLEPQEYEKLVRDRVPERITRIGLHRPITRTASPEEIVRLLRDKLIEELHEYEAASVAKRSVELADVLEVLRALCGRLTLDPLDASSDGTSLLAAATAMAQRPDAIHAANLLAHLHREAEQHGIAWSEVERARADRAAERGTYDNGVYLVRTVWARDPHS